MSTPTPNFRALRAWRRGDHLAEIRDEIANALTHGVGAAAALAGGAVLITLAAIGGDGWQLAGAIVFGITLLLLYTASTLYHAIQHPIAKGRLKVFDHCAIYLLIAGTYTPFTLVGLRGPWGWGLFAAIWTLALAGVVFKLFYTGRYPRLSTAIYVAMGWLVVVAMKPMLGLDRRLDPGLAARRRRVLHPGYLLLPPRVDSLCARDLAPVRDRRQRLPLRGGGRTGGMRPCGRWPPPRGLRRTGSGHPGATGAALTRRCSAATAPVVPAGRPSPP